VYDAGQAGRQGTTWQEGGRGQTRQAGGGQQDKKTGVEDTTRGGATRPPLCAAWGGPFWPPPGAA
jgi:hypothetical protein